MYKNFLTATRKILSYSGDSPFSSTHLSDGTDALDKDIALFYKQNKNIKVDPFYTLLCEQIEQLKKSINLEQLSKNISVVKTVVEECCNHISIDKKHHACDLPESFSLFTLPILLTCDAPISIEITESDAQNIEKIIRNHQLLQNNERIVLGKFVFSLSDAMDSPLAMHTMLNIGADTILKQKAMTFVNGAINSISNQGADIAFIIGVIASDCSALLNEDFDEIEGRGGILSKALLDDRETSLCAMQDDLTHFFSKKNSIDKSEITFLSPESYQSSLSQLRAFSNVAHLMEEYDPMNFTAVKFYIAEEMGRLRVFASLKMKDNYHNFPLPYQDEIAGDLDVVMHYEALDMYVSNRDIDTVTCSSSEQSDKINLLH